MFIKVKQALEKGASLKDKFKLIVLGAYTSRPQLKRFLQPYVSFITKNELIEVKIKTSSAWNKPIIIFLRKQEFQSDYLSMLELLLFNCYRLPIPIKPDLIIDGGGNTGLFTLLSNRFYPGVPILLFEPVDNNLVLIDKHLLINNSHSTNYKGIISTFEGDIPFYIRNANNSSFDSTQPYKEVVPVRSYNLLNELNKHVFETILIKLDIEGAEVDVIPQLLNNLASKKIYIVGELHNWPLALDPLQKQVADAGYKIDIFDQDKICLLFHIYKNSIQKA